MSENSPQITREQFNMSILEFLVNNPCDFWNANEITHKAAKGLNNTRVKKSLIYFINKNFVLNFKDLPIEQQKKAKRDSVKDISSDSFQITKYGIKTFEKIKESCLDPVSQRLLGIKK